MRVEISIAKEKAAKMPKGSMEALKDEMTRRISKQYDDVEVIVKTASNGKRAARTVLTGMCYSVGSATRQGSSSLTRFIGQSAMTSRT